MRIATYNVRNLIEEEDAAATGVPVKTSQERRALAATVAAVGADVVLLQEVGSEALLAGLNESLSSPYPFFAVQPGNSARGIHLGILSREPVEIASHRRHELTDESGLPLEDYETAEDAAAGRPVPLRIQRDLMLAEIFFEGSAGLALYNVHLKSKTNRAWRMLPADVVRGAECRLVADLIGDYIERHPDRPVLLGGDFNDTRSSAVLAPLFALPFADPQGEALARTGGNPSTYWPRRRMRLDFLLTSGAAGRLVVPGSETIHASLRARRASDHYPVSLDLDLDLL